MQPATTSTTLIPDAASSAAEAGLWLQFLAKLTGQAVDRLPQIWQLIQVSEELQWANLTVLGVNDFAASLAA